MIFEVLGGNLIEIYKYGAYEAVACTVSIDTSPEPLQDLKKALGALTVPPKPVYIFLSSHIYQLDLSLL